MIQMVGVNKNIDIHIRERLSIKPKKIQEYTIELLEEFEEVLIISTCNRTEIYFNGSNDIEKLKKIFKILNWNDELRECTFNLQEEGTITHLMEVACGFHSKILGEDQILGQIKTAFEIAKNNRAVNGSLERLFQTAITCGKKFRTLGKFYEIPVSSASIAVNEVVQRGAKSLMIIGYGEVGNLVLKYALAHNIPRVTLVLRDLCKADDVVDSRVKKIGFNSLQEEVNEVEAIISCTSAPHLIIKEDFIKESSKLIIFDLSVPRDVDSRIKCLSNVTLFDIDDITDKDDLNRSLRKDRMEEYRFVVTEHINEFTNWLLLRDVSNLLKEVMETGNEVVMSRTETFTNRYDDIKEGKLVYKLIKSTADYYINRGIEVLKEETLKGNKEETIKIISKIFSK